MAARSPIEGAVRESCHASGAAMAGTKVEPKGFLIALMVRGSEGWDRDRSPILWLDQGVLWRFWKILPLTGAVGYVTCVAEARLVCRKLCFFRMLSAV
jgi:hypothetical protein